VDRKELKYRHRFYIALLFIFLGFSCFPYSNPKVEAEIRVFYGLPPGQTVTLREYDSQKDLPPRYSSIPSFAAGAALPETGEIFIFRSRLGPYPFGSIEQVYAHELSHVYLYRAAGMRLPRWFDEGVAMHLAGEWGGRDDFYLALALPGIARGNFSLANLEADFSRGESSNRRSYAVSRAFVRDIFKYRGDAQGFIALVRKTGSFDRAFIEYFNLSEEAMFERWAKKLPWWGPLYSMVASASSIWFFVVLLFLLASLVTLVKRRKWKKKWEEEEERDRQSREPVH